VSVRIRRRINIIANEPGELWVSTQCEILKLRYTDVATVCVQVAHDEDVVRFPALLDGGMYLR